MNYPKKYIVETSSGTHFVTAHTEQEAKLQCLAEGVEVISIKLEGIYD